LIILLIITGCYAVQIGRKGSNYVNKGETKSSNLNSSVSVINSWLGEMFWNITFIPLTDEEVKDILALLDEGN